MAGAESNSTLYAARAALGLCVYVCVWPLCVCVWPLCVCVCLAPVCVCEDRARSSVSRMNVQLLERNKVCMCVCQGSFCAFVNILSCMSPKASAQPRFLSVCVCVCVCVCV